jgi:hypothetical protein
LIKELLINELRHRGPMIGVRLAVDGAVLFTLVAVTTVIGRANAVSGRRFSLLGGALAGLAAAGTWMSDLPRWA